jgi:hypothetical protein
MLYTNGSGKRRPEEMGKKGKKVYCTDGREKKWHLGTISVKLYIKFEKKKEKTWGSSFHY